MLATSLAACALTIMAMKAEGMGIAFTGARAEVLKEMAANPRRVAKVKIDFYLNLPQDESLRSLLEATAHACPVAKSLSAELEQEFVFHYSS